MIFSYLDVHPTDSVQVCCSPLAVDIHAFIWILNNFKADFKLVVVCCCKLNNTQDCDEHSIACSQHSVMYNGDPNSKLFGYSNGPLQFVH